MNILPTRMGFFFHLFSAPKFSTYHLPPPSYLAPSYPKPPPSYLPPTYHLPTPPPLIPSPELQRRRAVGAGTVARAGAGELELERDPRAHQVRCPTSFFCFFCLSCLKKATLQHNVTKKATLLYSATKKAFLFFLFCCAVPSSSSCFVALQRNRSYRRLLLPLFELRCAAAVAFFFSFVLQEKRRRRPWQLCCCRLLLLLFCVAQKGAKKKKTTT